MPRPCTGNPYDGHTLGPVIADLEKLTGVAARGIHGDKGYRGEAVKLQPDPTPLNLQIGPAEAALAVLNPSAAQTLTDGEDAAEFNSLVKAVTEFWQPQDVIERMQMADFIHAHWELVPLTANGAVLPFAPGSPLRSPSSEGRRSFFGDSAFPTGRYRMDIG